MSTTSRNERHAARMKRTKEIVDKRIADAQEERGVIILLSGNGKGKSSSAFGMAARSLGHGLKVGVVQFLKGRFETGEHRFFSQQDNVDYHVMGDGFTWETQNREQDTASAEKAWNLARIMLQDDSYHLVILDEITYMYKYNYLSLNESLAAFKARPVMQNLVITGRGAHRELKRLADTVSIINDDKHAFRDGVKAQKGIEW